MRYDDDRNQTSYYETPSDNGRSGRSVTLIVGAVGLLVAAGICALMVTFTQADEDEQAALENPPTSAEPFGTIDDAPVAAVPIPEDALDDDLPKSPADQLREAQGRVDSLETELSARDAELAALKQEIARGDEADQAARARARARQDAIQHELQSLRVALNEAVDERDALRGELKEALAEIDRQVHQNVKLRTVAVAYKEASTENLWSAFTNNAKVRICDRGTHRRRVDCEADLDAWFDASQHAAFTSCVNTSQAIPMLWEGDPEVAPANAAPIDARDRERGDNWFVVYCDPSLPQGVIARDITDETPAVFADASK